MKKFFIASICRGGILGGGIFADDEGITFRTGKVTVPVALRHLEMKYGDIREFSEKRVLFFPVFTIAMKDGESYPFLIFSPKSFRTLLGDKVNRA